MTAEPRRADPAVYDAIYAVPGGAPGYDRYFQLARGVKRTRNAMQYLASRQDALWGVERALRAHGAKRILEVGCGLGYLTYALRQSGYDATGIDISQEAVAFARQSYGDYFSTESLESHLANSNAVYDAIVMVELIEHLEEPIELLEKTLPLLKPGGRIVLTTPNRTYLGYDESWATDLPPVHLWWFSEESVRAIGDRLNCSVNFTDFREYNQRYPIFRAYRALPVPMFDASGRLVRRESLPFAILRRLGALHETYWIISVILGVAHLSNSARRQVIVASLKPA
jgi:SAM-dependent methyltransferase